MGTSVLSEEEAGTAARQGVGPGRVSFAKLDLAQSQPSPERAIGEEEFEIAIGGWSVTIVRQVDDWSRRVRLRARIEPAPGKKWNRRRERRLVERLNARRRFPD